jgi:hypothetical protein
VFLGSTLQARLLLGPVDAPVFEDFILGCHNNCGPFD